MSIAADDILSTETSHGLPSRQAFELNELRSLSETVLPRIEELPTREGNVSQLPPVDRGRGAWSYLAGAFIIEGLCWGKLRFILTK